jgi:hypothetical protein
VVKRKYQLNTKRMDIKILEEVYKVNPRTQYGHIDDLEIDSHHGVFLSIDGFIIGEIKKRDSDERPYFIDEVFSKYYDSREKIIEESIKSIDGRIKLLQDQKAQIQKL